MKIKYVTFMFYLFNYLFLRFGAQQRISRGEPVEEEKAEQQVADHRVRATPTEHRGKNLKTQLKDTHTHMHVYI